VGNREVLDYGGGRKAQFLNGRVFKLTGFPESMISEGQAPDPLEHQPPIRLQHRLRIITIKTLSVNFGSINNQREETFTLSSSPYSKTTQKASPSISDRIHPLITYVKSMDPQTFTLRRCGIGAARAERFKRILKAEDCRFENPSIKTTIPITTLTPHGGKSSGAIQPRRTTTLTPVLKPNPPQANLNPKNPPLLNLRYHLH